MKKTVIVSVISTAISGAAMASHEGPIEHVLIIGSKEDARELPGSGHVITEEDIGKFEYSDVNALLRQVPGVYLRLEDGYGLRPNIGIRSANSGPERSNKITLLEDGVPVQPAPYAASAAYYSPTAGRMSGMEVLKGPAAITEGPHTVGGAVNYVATPIPQDSRGMVKLEAGEGGHMRAQASYGASYDNGGWLVEGYQHQADGFKDIEQVGGDSGLDKQDWLVKARINTDADANIYQQLDLKLLYSDEESEQSYLGLTESDFNRDPYRRYAVSGEDLMDVEHQQAVLTHTIEFNDSLTLRSSAYYHETSRNWFKVSKVGEAGGSLSSIGSVIEDANNGDIAAQVLLSGSDADAEIKNNNRNYRVKGIQSRLDWSFTTGDIGHDLAIGVRYHEDEEDRFQRVDDYELRSGNLMLAERGEWGVGSNNNRLTWAEAFSFYIADDIHIGDVTVTPGLRHENVKVTRLRWDGPVRADAFVQDSKSGSNKQSEWMPSLGATWQVNDQLLLLAGVYEGFSPAGYDKDTDPEKSTNWELGFRYQQDDLQVELIGFYSDYDNILGECTQVASCSVNSQGNQENGGQAEVTGVEFTLAANLASGENYALPVSLAYTWMESEYGSSFDSDLLGQEVAKGDRLLYTPENLVNASVGWVSGPFEAHLSASYVDESCVNTSCETSLDKTDSIFNTDLSLSYHFAAGYEVYLKVENLTDEADVISRAPDGARVQKPRSGLVGVKFEF